jgi:hypothetical protein
MTLLDYHRLQRQEVESWDPVQIEDAVRAQDDGFPERVMALVPAEGDKSPISRGSPLFERIQALCELWLAATPEQRTFIRSRMDAKRAYRLGGFRAEAKRLADETKSDSWLRLALASLAIENLNNDARDVILSVQGLLVASRKIQADWGGLVHGVAALAGPAVSALLEDCLRNHPS